MTYSHLRKYSSSSPTSGSKEGAKLRATTKRERDSVEADIRIYQQ